MGAISGEGEEISLDAGRRKRETTMTEFTDCAVKFGLRLLDNVESVYVSKILTVISPTIESFLFLISTSKSVIRRDKLALIQREILRQLKAVINRCADFITTASEFWWKSK